MFFEVNRQLTGHNKTNVIKQLTYNSELEFWVLRNIIYECETYMADIVGTEKRCPLYRDSFTFSYNWFQNCAR